MKQYFPHNLIVSNILEPNISALLFAIIHMNPYQFIEALHFGVMFGYEYYKTQSLGNTIILHSCVNISGLFSAYIFSEYYTEIVIENQIYCILFIVGLYVASENGSSSILVDKTITAIKVL